MVVRQIPGRVQTIASHTLMVMGVVASRMRKYRLEGRSSSQCEGSDGGGKDRTGGWVGQRRKKGEYEGMKGDGKSIVAKERHGTNEED